MNLITKKLRDVTKEEFAEARDRICRETPKFNCRGCPFRHVACSTKDEDCWVNHKDLFSDKFLDQIIEVEASEILTKEEKEYLSAVIKPFRDKVTEIFKYNHPYLRQYNISIYYLDEGGSKKAVRLPDFPYETMYKGMGDDRPYTLEELGLLK